MSITRINPAQRMSDVVIFNQSAYWAEVPENTDADIIGQTENMLNLAEETLTQIGSDKKSIISATIFLKDVSQVDKFNSVWDQWLPSGHAPVRACVQADMVDPNMQVEIQFIAAVLN